jgi:hypothetical protein
VLSLVFLAFAFAGVGRARALGAMDEAAAERRVERLARELERIDDGEEALRDLLLGRALRRGRASAYAYAAKALCGSYGDPLPNASFYPLDVEALGRLLDLLKLGLARHELIGSRSPIPGLPPVDDFPASGWLPPERCAALDEALATVQLDPRDLGDDAAWGRAALAELEGWLATCADGGLGLATFYH